MTKTQLSKEAQRLNKTTNQILGRKTPKKKHTTTGIIMDSDHLQTLRTVAHWRVLTGEAEKASVSDLVREAVAEYIERHGLYAEEYTANNRDRLGPAS